MGMNRVLLHGYVGKDAELKTTSGGKSYCKFSLATTETWKDPGGEKQSKTEWHQIVAWGKKGENASKFIKKGMELFVEGKVEYQDVPDKDDSSKKFRFTTIKLENFDFCGKRGDTGGSYAPDPEPSGRDTMDSDTNGGGDTTASSYDDDIPF